jgi:SAM-dependent methyltransferase
VLTGFDGTHLQHLEHLKYDVTNLAHYLRDRARVLVIGVGGGRDVLSALLFGQERVVAVDLNQDILEIVNGRFGDYTGHLDRHPAVRFVHDEARSYVTRQEERFDIIQASLVDTFTASAAGAYMLSEHTIYTVEAWKSFLEHLTPRGILTFSRFYIPGLPGETHRLTALASAALRQLGIEEPRAHIVVARNQWQPGVHRRVSGSTILVSPSPFSDRDLDRLEGVVEKMRFEILVSPRSAVDPTFEILAADESLEESFPDLPVDVSAPTDDKPFFFFMLKPRQALSGGLPDRGDFTAPIKGIAVLVTLLLVVLTLTSLCIVAPLLVRTRLGSLAGGTPFLVFFAAIGTGFMLIEISQLQRLSIFLGHPIYGLSVVLFALLLSSGLGSWTIQRVRDDATRRQGSQRLALLVVGLAALGALTPTATQAFRSATTEWRIGVAIALLFPIGLLMGMAFPLGMRVASRVKPELTPWFWGINGAASVCASVISVVLALIWGITATYWTGVACYGVALLAFLLAGRAPDQS